MKLLINSITQSKHACLQLAEKIKVDESNLLEQVSFDYFNYKHPNKPLIQEERGKFYHNQAAIEFTRLHKKYDFTIEHAAQLFYSILGLSQTEKEFLKELL